MPCDFKWSGAEFLTFARCRRRWTNRVVCVSLLRPRTLSRSTGASESLTDMMPVTGRLLFAAAIRRTQGVFTEVRRQSIERRR